MSDTVDLDKYQSRFWERVDKPVNELMCWRWTGCVQKNGYGRVSVGGKLWLTHRLAYQLVRGAIPEGLTLDHVCRNRGCVNPWHLDAVSMRTNVLRGISRAAQNAQKTHCSNGHEFTPENTVRWAKRPNGRWCRECLRLKSARRYARERQSRAN